VRLARTLLAAVALGALASAPVAAASGPAWTTYHHDGLRSGVDPDSTSPLPPVQAWQTAQLDGQLYGQPLVYGGRVYVATENDSVYSLDAATGSVVWYRHFGTPVPDGHSSPMGCGDLGRVGVTSTPVIDPASGQIFAVGDRWNGSDPATIQHVLAGYALSDGTQTVARVVDPAGSVPRYQLQRSALALDAGRIVIGFGGNSGDCNSYHGWVVSAPESGSGPLAQFEVDAHGNGGAVWGAGNAPAIDSAGDIWIATGNGDSSLGNELQESVLKLTPELSLAGHWTPSNWNQLDQSDADIGSSEPLPLPGGMYFQIGKDGVGHLLSSAPAELYEAQVCSGGAFGGGVYDAGRIYVACSEGLRAISLNGAAHTFSDVPGWIVNSSAVGPPIVAAGLVWSAGWHNGTLYALDPASGATRFSASPGSFDHFTSPSAGGGRLFVGTGERVTAFTIAKPPATTPPPPPRAAPVLTHLRVSVRTQTLSLTLSEPAGVKLVISRVLHGRRARGRCRIHARHGRRCTLLIHKSTRTFLAHSGPNTFRLHLARLAAGRYIARITATSAGGLRSKRYTLRFGVDRRR
jgi:hypothetical protein